jgi:hypothetical protein
MNAKPLKRQAINPAATQAYYDNFHFPRPPAWVT